MMRNRYKSALAALLVAGLAGVAMPAFASAAPTEIQALKALDEAKESFEGGAASEGTTIALRNLALALPALESTEAREARQILARPPEGNGSFGGDWPRPSHFKEKTVETPAFVVHYPVYDDCNVNDRACDEPSLKDTSPANGTPDYIDATVQAVNDSIAVENVELGWALPKGDGDKGEANSSVLGDRFDIYISDLCTGPQCVFGYASPDDQSANCQSPPFKCSAHLVLDNDYAEFGESGGLLGLRVTTAHEYNHVLQFNLDANQDGWMFESTATWSEEQVFPDDDDWIRSYMDNWADTTTSPITSVRAGGGLRIYGSAIWNHWIEHGDGNYGPDVVLDAWELSRDVNPKDDAVASYDQAIKDSGGEGFYPEFVAFASSTAEWNTGLGSLPDSQPDAPGDEDFLPDVERLGRLKLGAESSKVTLDNTSYQLMRVNAKDAESLKLKVKAPRGVRWGLALVGRLGDRFSGDAIRVDEFQNKTRKGKVELANAQNYNRITVAIVNADDSKNDANFKAKVR